MALLKNWQGSQQILFCWIIDLFCSMAWFISFSLEQFNICEGVTKSINIPALGITCVGNLMDFVTTLISGRLDLESEARDYFNILGCRKLRIINEINRNEVTT